MFSQGARASLPHLDYDTFRRHILSMLHRVQPWKTSSADLTGCTHVQMPRHILQAWLVKRFVSDNANRSMCQASLLYVPSFFGLIEHLHAWQRETGCSNSLYLEVLTEKYSHTSCFVMQRCSLLLPVFALVQPCILTHVCFFSGMSSMTSSRFACYTRFLSLSCIPANKAEIAYLQPPLPMP